jgi:hypothetical protein
MAILLISVSWVARITGVSRRTDVNFSLKTNLTLATLVNKQFLLGGSAQWSHSKWLSLTDRKYSKDQNLSLHSSDFVIAVFVSFIWLTALRNRRHSAPECQLLHIRYNHGPSLVENSGWAKKPKATKSESNIFESYNAQHSHVFPCRNPSRECPREQAFYVQSRL